MRAISEDGLSFGFDDGINISGIFWWSRENV
jgi:hypothetical protein